MVDMCVYSVCALIAVWLDASQSCQGGVELNDSAREVQNKLSNCVDWVQRSIKTNLFTFTTSDCCMESMTTSL